MAGRITMTAFAGPKEGFHGPVPIYVSATNDQGKGMTGFTKDLWELGLLDPVLSSQEEKWFKPQLNGVSDLGNGFYRVRFGNSVKKGVFLSGPVILSLRMRRHVIGVGSDVGQTLVSFTL